MNKVEEIQNYLKENLSAFRYQHSLKVASCARELAHIYNLDENEAYLAGLIHDIARELSDKENHYWLQKNNYSLNFYELSLAVIHSFIGSLMAKEMFNLNNNICNAIKYHTFGNKKMNKFAKIIFIADKIARENLNSCLKTIKDEVYLGYLDYALVLFLRYQKAILKSKGLKIHSDTTLLLKNLELNLKGEKNGINKS